MRLVVVLFLVLGLATASPSCCEGKKKASDKCPRYEIPDPRDRLDRQTRWVPDPAAKKPAGWDDEDDGEWEADMIPDPNFVPPPVKMVRNPEFRAMCFAEAWLEDVAVDLLDALP